MSYTSPPGLPQPRQLSALPLTDHLWYSTAGGSSADSASAQKHDSVQSNPPALLLIEITFIYLNLQLELTKV